MVVRFLVYDSYCLAGGWADKWFAHETEYMGDLFDIKFCGRNLRGRTQIYFVASYKLIYFMLL